MALIHQTTPFLFRQHAPVFIPPSKFEHDSPYSITRCNIQLLPYVTEGPEARYEMATAQ